MSPLFDLENHIQSTLKRGEDLVGENPIENDTECSNSFKGDKFPQFPCNPRCYSREKVYKFVIKKLIEPLIISKKISKYCYKEKTDWYQRHHCKVGNGACEHNATVSKKIYKTSRNDFEIFHSFTPSLYSWVEIAELIVWFVIPACRESFFKKDSGQARMTKRIDLCFGCVVNVATINHEVTFNLTQFDFFSLFLALTLILMGVPLNENFSLRHFSIYRMLASLKTEG